MEKPITSYVTYLVTTPEKLWSALTKGEITRQYFMGRRIESDWKVGSPFTLWMEDGRLDTQGEVLACEPGRILKVTWHVEWLEEYRRLPEVIVEYKIDPLGELVRLTVAEYHPSPIPERYLEGGRRGWPVILCGLKTLLETGRPMPAVDLGFE